VIARSVPVPIADPLPARGVEPRVVVTRPKVFVAVVLAVSTGQRFRRPKCGVGQCVYRPQNEKTLTPVRTAGDFLAPNWHLSARKWRKTRNRRNGKKRKTPWFPKGF